MAQDTVTGNHALAMVRFSGYEKRLRATRETLFATNLADCDIVVAQFTIDYFDSSGRQLHRRTAATSTPIPAGQTRRIDLESWDRQNSFYSPAEVRPKVPAIPYTIKISDPRIVLNR